MTEPHFEPPPLERPGLLARLLVDVRPFRLRDFRRLWLGQAISLLGSMISFVGIPYQLYQLTHSTLQVGLLAFCDLVPLLTLALIGGTIADAVDRRRLILVTEIGFAFVSLLLAGNAALAQPRVWALYALSFLGAAFWCLGSPALRSLTPRIVPADQLTAAVALNSVYSNLGAVVGPAVGGVLIAAFGLTTTYLIDFGTFAASIIAIALLPAIPPDAEADKPGLRSLLEGFRFVRRQRVVMGIFLLDTNAMIFGMPSALFPAFAVVAAFAAVWGVAITGFGFANALWLALLFLALAGAADFVSAALRSTIVLEATPDSMRGRVSGIELAQVASAPTLGNVEAGVLASFTSLRFSVVSGGIACVVGTLALVAAIPEILRHRRAARS